MSFNSAQRRLFCSGLAVLLGFLNLPPATAQQAGDPNARGYVALNTAVANMAAQRFGPLPSSTQYFPTVGLTMFPYYQASAPLKEFLNSSTITGMKVTDIPGTNQTAPFSLPATDLIRRSFSLPTPMADQNKAMKLAIKDKKNRDEVPWMVAHDGGESFVMPGDPDAMVLVSSGTIFGAAQARTLLLRCGTMWVLTASRPAAVLTKHGAVCVKPYSIAAIEQTWFSNVRVADLYGQPLEVQLASQEKSSKVVVQKGKELSVSHAVVAAAGASDYVAKQAMASAEQSPELAKASALLPDLNMALTDIHADSDTFIAELKGVSPPINGLRMSNDFQRMFSGFGITPAMRRAEIQKRTLQRYNLATKPAVQKAAIESRNYIPGLTPDAGPVKFPHVDAELKTVRIRQGMAKCLSNAEFKFGVNGRPEISRGEAVFVLSQGGQVCVNDSQVFCHKGVTLHVDAENGVTVVRNIGEAEPGSVKLKIKNRVYEIPLGSELMVCANAPDLFDQMKMDGVGRRNVHAIEVQGGGLFMNKSEFDMTTLMQYSPLMRKLYKSHDESDKNLVMELMKTNVSLNMVTGVRGGYRRMSGLAGPH